MCVMYTPECTVIVTVEPVYRPTQGLHSIIIEILQWEVDVLDGSIVVT